MKSVITDDKPNETGADIEEDLMEASTSETNPQESQEMQKSPNIGEKGTLCGRERALSVSEEPNAPQEHTKKEKRTL